MADSPRYLLDNHPLWDDFVKRMVEPEEWKSGLVADSLGVLVQEGTAWVTAGQIVAIGIEASLLKLAFLIDKNASENSLHLIRQPLPVVLYTFKSVEEPPAWIHWGLFENEEAHKHTAQIEIRRAGHFIGADTPDGTYSVKYSIFRKTVSEEAGDGDS